MRRYSRPRPPHPRSHTIKALSVRSNKNTYLPGVVVDVVVEVVDVVVVVVVVVVLDAVVFVVLVVVVDVVVFVVVVVVVDVVVVVIPAEHIIEKFIFNSYVCI